MNQLRGCTTFLTLGDLARGPTSCAIQMNGALVSRNESIIYGGPSLNFNYDCRLLGGSASLIGDMLPRTLSPFWLHDWMVLDTDPNVGVVP